MSILNINDKIGIVACSNGHPKNNQAQIETLLCELKSLGLNPICSDYIYSITTPFNGSAKEKGKAFMDLYKDNDIKALFDISGGDLANEVLEYLDYDFIARNPKPIFGYSDLTTVLNSIYSQTNNPVYLYQIRNILYSNSQTQKSNIINSLFNDKNDLFKFSYKFIQGKSLEGIVIGGNIRCLLKLAGTKYMPDFTDKIIFLESMGGDAALMSAFLNQLKQIGVFDKVRGVILGTFSKMQKDNIIPSIEELAIKIINNPSLPIVKTEDIGHGDNSKCLIIGKNLSL